MDVAALFAEEHAQDKPENLIDSHAEQFPLNRNLLAGLDKPVGLSPRVRLRQAVVSLRDGGLEVSGAEPSQKRKDAVVEFVARFDRQGDLHDQIEVVISRDADYPAVATLVQAALHEQGFQAIVGADRIQIEFDEVEIVEAALEWAALGVWKREARKAISPADAEPWIVATELFRDAGRIVSWRTAGLTPADAMEWIDVHPILSYYDRAKAWESAGLSPDDVRPWVIACADLYDYRTAKRWIDSGLTPEQVAPWAGCRNLTFPTGSNSVDCAQQMTKVGFTPDDVNQLLTAGWRGDHLAALARILNKGADLTEARGWIAFGSHFVQHHAETWRSAGMRPKDVAPWVETKRASLFKWDHASQWMTLGVGPVEAGQWLELNYKFQDPNLAASWLNAGLTREDAAAWLRYNPSGYGASQDFTNADIVHQWKACHPACEEPATARKLAEAGITPDQVKTMLDVLGLPA